MQQPTTMNNMQDAYRKQAILTASPMELILMLYDGCRKNVMKAQLAMQKGKLDVADEQLDKAMEIIYELVNSLDMTLAISKELVDLYDYMVTALAVGKIKKDPTHLNTVLEMLAELRDAWQQVNDSQRGTLSLKEE